MTRPRILITAQFLRAGDGVDAELRERGFEPVHAPWTRRRTEEELIDLAHDVHGAVIAGEPFTARVLDACPHLRVLARAGVGYDSIDVDAATQRGVVVCNVPGVNAVSVAELTVGLVLMSARRLAENQADLERGGWRRLEGQEIAGKTLGIVGLGAIGRAVAERAQALGMTVLAHDLRPDATYARSRAIEYVEMGELARASDFVSLHLFASGDSRHLVDECFLRSMKPSAHLINTARGSIVDQAALVTALREGWIAGAALDVMDPEPLPLEDPLRSLPNVLLIPHLGGVTAEARARSGREAAARVIDVLTGTTPDAVVNAAAFRVPRHQHPHVQETA